MQIKRYRAPSYAEALLMAKQELGSNAMIVETRTVREGGIFGLFGRQLTEVTVAAEPRTAQEGVAHGARAENSRPADMGADSLHTELAALRLAMDRLASQTSEERLYMNLSGPQRRVFDLLVSKGANPEVANKIAEPLPARGNLSKRRVKEALHEYLAPYRPINPQPGRRHVVTFVGPTGVGKTTTVAKLAAHFALVKGLSVALVTSDTFRIAAIAQLQTYAQILNVPVYSVDTLEDIEQVSRETADRDLVLVDTGGRNHRDRERMQELTEVLRGLRPDEVQLVLSMTMNPVDMFDILGRYEEVGIDRLLLTKQDEAGAPGVLLNLRQRTALPISYIAVGQSVPDDLTEADEADFLALITGGDQHG